MLTKNGRRSGGKGADSPQAQLTKHAGESAARALVHSLVNSFSAVCIAGVTSPITKGQEFNPKGAILGQGYQGVVCARLLSCCPESYHVIGNACSR